jgi:hypothetical protein
VKKSSQIDAQPLIPTSQIHFLAVITMKFAAVFVSSLAVASAFVPQQAGRASTQVDALFDDVSAMTPLYGDLLKQLCC